MKPKLYDVQAAKAAVTGPVPSVCTPFLENGDIDYEGLGRIVDFLVQARAPSLLLTFGDSLFSVLADGEVAEVTRTVVKAAAGRAAVIACGKQWWTGQSLAFAEFCREAGADMLIPVVPDWAHSAEPALMAELYRRAGRILPVMALTNLMSGRGVPLEVFEQLLGEDCGVVAVKDDMPPPYGRRLGGLLAGRWAMLSGGLMENHMDTAPYGADGYLSLFMRFAPHIDVSYWKAFTAGDMKACAALVERYEAPFFKLCTAEGVDFSAAIQGMMSLTGQCGRWRRAPYATIGEDALGHFAALDLGAG